MPQKKPLPPLPGPVLHIIFKQLKPAELRDCRLVCRLWKQVITFYNFIPELDDFCIDCRSLLKKSWSPKRFIRPQIAPKLHSLQENYLQNSSVYFIRPNPEVRVLGFEELKTFTNFFSPSIISFLCDIGDITILTLESIDGSKLKKMNLQHFPVLISHLPSLTRLTLPLLLLDVFQAQPHCKSHLLFSNLEYLQIHLPTLSIEDEEGTEFVRQMSSVAVLFASNAFPFLEHLSLSSEPFAGLEGNKSLKSQEMSIYFDHITKIGNLLGDALMDNLTDMVLSMFELKTFSLSLLPVTMLQNSGILGLFAYLGMRNLAQLNLSVVASTLDTSLPTMLHMLLNYGCKVDLNLDFFLHGTESQLRTQYLLSLPEVCESLTSLTLHFLGDYDQHHHIFFLEDFIPFYTRLSERERRADFKKLTKFTILFQRPIRRVFLTFAWLHAVWPHLVHITIIMGKPEIYQSERGIAWSKLKDKWKGRLNTSVSNVFYLRGILKYFPKLESLVFWADLQKISDSFMVRSEPPILRGSCARRFLLSHLVPELKELSLRGLGPRITNDCLPGFYGMKKLRSLELIGNHAITNSAKSKLFEETPSLQQIKFKL